MVTRRQAQLRLAGADWLQDARLRRIFSALGGSESRTRAVGGLVRDTLLGRSRDNGDVDLATEFKPDEVSRRLEAIGMRVVPTGITHGTVTVAVEGLVVEVTTLREDVATDGRHAVVRYGSDWTRDAERRDFTMNALYCDADGTLFDPLDGIADCIAGRVRFIGDPARRLAEDRLRAYRFFRFSASHAAQTFDAAGLAAVAQAAGDLGRLSAERVGGEMLRMLALPKVALTLDLMTRTGVLRLPCDGDAQSRYEDLADPATANGRVALLLRETGAADLQAAWRLSSRIAATAEATLKAAAMVITGDFAAAAHAHAGVLGEALPVAGALERWDRATIEALRQRQSDLRVPPFPLTGADLIALGLVPGRALGQELARLERLWIDSAFTLDRAQLLSSVRRP